jgi:hypothetical protein
VAATSRPGCPGSEFSKTGAAQRSTGITEPSVTLDRQLEQTQTVSERPRVQASRILVVFDTFNWWWGSATLLH